jgi:hypothetical protein
MNLQTALRLALLRWIHMYARLMTSMIATFSLLSTAHAADSADAETVSRLDQSKHTLVEGIRQAAKTHGPAISAKFEFEDGKLWLSVYTAQDGIAADAEHNKLVELKGEPDKAAWSPGVEVFEDKKHLTRAAMQLTLLQLSRLDLAALIEKAASSAKGIPYSAVPAVRNGKPVLMVKFAEPSGTSHMLDIPL